MPGLLFSGGGLAARELPQAQLPLLQAYHDANPEYFLTINGRMPPPGFARQEFDERPPAHMPYSQRWFAGLWDMPAVWEVREVREAREAREVRNERQGRHEHEALAGAIELLSDFMAPGVWHLGFFGVATRLHGSGAAPRVFDALCAWAEAQGAAWMRLGVVQGNARAERFWAHHGFVEVRLRHGVDTGGRLNTIRVMVRPLVRGRVEDYLQLVVRDRPESPLA